MLKYEVKLRKTEKKWEIKLIINKNKVAAKKGLVSGEKKSSTTHAYTSS